MNKPLALIYYSNLMPGSHLTMLLQELGYEVQAVSDAAMLAESCEKETPLVVIAELFPAADVCAAVARLKGNPATRHVPVLGYCQMCDAAAQAQARKAGVDLLAAQGGVAEQLPQLLDQILQVE
jgi:PleD family two-component response regulator